MVTRRQALDLLFAMWEARWVEMSVCPSCGERDSTFAELLTSCNHELWIMKQVMLKLGLRKRLCHKCFMAATLKRGAVGRVRATGSASAACFTRADLDRMMIKQEGLCTYCGCSLARGYHIEHKRPISRGGGNEPENVHLTCETCNLRKGRLTHDEFVKKMLDSGKSGNQNTLQLDRVYQCALDEKQPAQA